MWASAESSPSPIVASEIWVPFVAPGVNFRQNGLDANAGKCDPVCAELGDRSAEAMEARAHLVPRVDRGVLSFAFVEAAVDVGDRRWVCAAAGEDDLVERAVEFAVAAAPPWQEPETGPRHTHSSRLTPDKSSPLGPGYAFMSAGSMVKLDTNAGKPSLTPLH